MFNPKPDLSTLDTEAIVKILRPYESAVNHVDRHMGAGCAGDAPGFPTYFLQSVYDRHGNTPRNGPDHVLAVDGKHYAITWEQVQKNRDGFYRQLWKPLPIEHPRVQAWITETYLYHANCYQDDSKSGSRPRLFIFPVPSCKLQHAATDSRFRDEINAEMEKAAKIANDEIVRYYTGLAIPENHDAVRIVRQFYPDHTPWLTRITCPPKFHSGDWWERHATRPTPEECPGDKMGHGGRKHPTSGSWCQFCGWYAAPESEP